MEDLIPVCIHSKYMGQLYSKRLLIYKMVLYMLLLVVNSCLPSVVDSNLNEYVFKGSLRISENVLVDVQAMMDVYYFEVKDQSNLFSLYVKGGSDIGFNMVIQDREAKDYFKQEYKDLGELNIVEVYLSPMEYQITV